MINMDNEMIAVEIDKKDWIRLKKVLEYTKRTNGYDLFSEKYHQTCELMEQHIAAMD